MIKISNRNLLVVASALLDDDSLQQEIKILNDLLPNVELVNKIADTTEIFDLNRCRHYKQTDAVIKRLQEKKLASFVFVSSKN